MAFSLVAGIAFGIPRVSAQHLATLSDDLLRWRSEPSSDRVRVIVSGTRDTLGDILLRHPVPIVRWLDEAVVLSVDRTDLAALAAEESVPHMSGDALVSPTMGLSRAAVGADRAAVGLEASFPFPALRGVTGRGVGVAVLDSGIAPHAALAGKVVTSVSLLAGDTAVTDAYGHGTHVAGIIAGAPMPASGSLPGFPGGIAPGVQVINVKVLGATGVGYTSDVIAGIDWALAHRLEYNIRVINLSVGHPVMEPALTDPLCQAVARAVAEGLIVVTSAGNDGRSVTGAQVLGGIGSPANSPFALTVGALNTWGTSDRQDDTVAEYSSRGPSRYDFGIKPDLVAPGTGIVSLEAAGSYLPAAHPAIHTAGTGANAYMRLNGTSMAAPMVSGAVAMLLEGSPALTWSQIKLALQTGATYVPEAGLTGAGAGSLDIPASRRIAADGLAQLSAAWVPGADASGAWFWDAGTLSARVYEGAGVRLVSALDLARVWTNPSVLQFGDLNLIGLLNPLRFIPRDRLLWGEQASEWVSRPDQIVWGSALSDSRGNQIIWGSTEGDDQIIWGTTTMTLPDVQ